MRMAICMDKLVEHLHAVCLEIARQWLLGNLSDEMAEYEMMLRNRRLLGYAELVLDIGSEDEDG